ncbi:spinster family MFS transporter [Rhizorhabdus dicambivorans]|uniref:MFS transporter n=1 Tax=Rhizorhabdus dicambivorans TaxID=1850238 RepID=A0A2A4FVJ9_9SPHN|nr:MFS transporter [Rhizorhabdus dicambivorans]ATE66237.1 MFS transporter [Rhizorhabdus dicambivorans]PCE41750.1 MFS transporter [Rhizorhabdus dicambivorans]
MHAPLKAMERTWQPSSLKALALLFAIAVVSYADRFTMGVLQVPIKADLGLSDAEIGALTGLAFFVPHTLLSIPMARLADRWNRKYLLVAALLLWSGMTAAMGWAASFAALFVLRMGVAIGESTCLPSCYSLIADYFRPAQRARAMAFFGLGLPVGSLIGLTGAGMIAARWGWQTAFFVVGSLGLLLAPIIAMALREPARDGDSGESNTPPPFGEAVALLWRMPSFRCIAIGNSCQTFIITASLTWSASFYTRAHETTLGEAALVVGILGGLAGGLGTLSGGFLTDRLGLRDRRWPMRLPAITAGLTVPATALQFLLPGFAPSVAAGVAAVFLANMHIPAVFATSQGLVPPRVRALTSGVLVMLAGLVGSVCGPLLTGWVSDLLQQMGQDDGSALRHAICLMLVFSAIASAAFYRASRHMGRQQP